ncbi:hypothetical protein BJV78DRAFT_1159379, partial [Lactifluus subvellereus]
MSLLVPHLAVTLGSHVHTARTANGISGYKVSGLPSEQLAPMASMVTSVLLAERSSGLPRHLLSDPSAIIVSLPVPHLAATLGSHVHWHATHTNGINGYEHHGLVGGEAFWAPLRTGISSAIPSDVVVSLPVLHLAATLGSHVHATRTDGINGHESCLWRGLLSSPQN